MSRKERDQVSNMFRLYSKDIFGVAFYVLKDQSLAKDIIMDVFEVLLKQDTLQHIENQKAWLLGTARNLSLKKFNKKIKTQYGLDQKNISDLFVEIEDSEEPIIKNANEEVLLAQLGLLKPWQSKCLISYYLQGLSYQQIADQEHLSLKEVKSYIQNGKRNLRIKLENLVQNE